MTIMSRLLTSLVGALVATPALAQQPNGRAPTQGTPQGYVQRMDAKFAQQSPKAGEALPDAAGFHADGTPFRLQDVRGKLTVLVTGCLT